MITIAGHSVAPVQRAGGMLSLRIALGDRSFVDLARALAKLEGVRVTGGPEGTGGDRCCVAQCPGFKMVVSAPGGAGEGFALVSRTPQAALSVMSDLGAALEHLMSLPPPAPDPPVVTTPSSLRPASLARGKPLARKTALRRNTPLARGRFR
jgi:hypothetical protein